MGVISDKYKDCCKPNCDPCCNQKAIYYCGKDIECLNIEKGEEIKDVIRKITTQLCKVSDQAELDTYIDVRDATQTECPTGGYVIEVKTVQGDTLVNSFEICTGGVETELNSLPLGTAYTIDVVKDEGIKILGTNALGVTQYTFTTTEDITYSDGLTLIANNEVDPNVFYHITDRDWYLRGLTPNSFEISGHVIQSCASASMYNVSGANKGVFDNNGSYLVGDKVVWGAQVWENTTGNNTGSLPANGYLVNLIANWTKVVDPSFYTDVVLKANINYEGDWVGKFEDKRGNEVSVPKEEYGTHTPLQGAKIFADWNAEGFKDNKIGYCLNNVSIDGDSTCIIEGNTGGNYYINKTDVISGNNIAMGIGKDVGGNMMFTYIKNNTINKSVVYNSQPIKEGEGYYRGINNNFIGEFNYNSLNNDKITPKDIENNVLYSVVSNQGVGVMANSYIVNCNNNTGITIYASKLHGEVGSNSSLRIYYSSCESNIKNNNVGNISNSSIAGTITFNSTVNITECTSTNISGNTNVSLDKNKAEYIDNNLNVGQIDHCIAETISGNEDITRISGNNSITIKDNKRGNFLSNNSITNKIYENTDFDTIQYNIGSYLEVNSNVTSIINNRAYSISLNDTCTTIIDNQCSRIDSNINCGEMKSNVTGSGIFGNSGLNVVSFNNLGYGIFNVVGVNEITNNCCNKIAEITLTSTSNTVDIKRNTLNGDIQYIDFDTTSAHIDVKDNNINGGIGASVSPNVTISTSITDRPTAFSWLTS